MDLGFISQFFTFAGMCIWHFSFLSKGDIQTRHTDIHSMICNADFREFPFECIRINIHNRICVRTTVGANAKVMTLDVLILILALLNSDDTRASTVLEYNWIQHSRDISVILDTGIVRMYV